MRPAKIYEQPPTLPGHCFKCKTGPPRRDYFFDLGFDTEYEGVVYICNLCMVEIVEASSDFASKAKLDSIVDTAKSFYDMAAKKSEKYEHLSKVLKAMGINEEKLLSYGRSDEHSDADPISDSGTSDADEPSLNESIGEPVTISDSFKF